MRVQDFRRLLHISYTLLKGFLQVDTMLVYKIIVPVPYRAFEQVNRFNMKSFIASLKGSQMELLPYYSGGTHVADHTWLPAPSAKHALAV
jgi:hypothetical protein